MKLGSTERRALKPDAQAFDEVRIFTVPRYKTSGMSGDEWRISARIQFWRKGKLIHETGTSRIETAVACVAWEYYRAIDDGKAFFAGEGDTCDQEGCAEKATVTYKLKQEFCRDAHPSNPYEYDQAPLVRKFCARHSRRGDCGFEDSDVNYEAISGAIQEPNSQDVKPAIFGGVIPVNPEKAN